MIVTIYQDNKLQANFTLGEAPRIVLKPQTMYCLRIYAKEANEEKIHLVPMEQSNLVVLRLSDQEPHGPNRPPLPDKALRLLLLAQFKLDNNSAIPKVVRWAFRMEDNFLPEMEPIEQNIVTVLQMLHARRDFSCRRIPLFVGPKGRSQFFVILSLVGAILLSEVYDFFKNPETQQHWNEIILVLSVLSFLLWLGLYLYGRIVQFFDTSE